jgi:HEAT repeat protein
MGFASRTLRIRTGEGRLAALLAGLMFVSMAAIAIGESGIDALFFDRIGTDVLPQMYLLQGGATFVAMLGLTGVLGRIGPRRSYMLAPLALGALVLAERIVLFTDVRWIYPVLWVTVALATLIQGIFLWGTAGAVVDTRQAKRLFPIFAAGGILGSVVGGLITRPLASTIGAENLLLVWVGALGAAFVLCRSALGPVVNGASRRVARRRASALRDMAQGFAFVRRSRLLVWMTAAAVFFSILFYSLYLPYAQAASDRFPDADELAGFFGLFWAGVTGVAFLVSMLLANRLFAWFGVAMMVIVLPLLYAGAFGILLLGSGFVTLVALRFAIGAWLQGVASPGWETLVNVVPESRRDQTRAFLNGGPTQVGTAVAGVVALVGQDVLTPRQLAVVGLVAAALTIVATFGIRRSYADALVEALRAGRPQVFDRGSLRGTPIPIAVDAEAARVLAESMRSQDPRVRRLVFQLFEDLPPEARPLGSGEGLDDPDPIVRLAAVRALDVSAASSREALLARADDPDAAVAAAAAARIVGFVDDPRPASRLRELLGADDAGTRRAALEQLSLAPSERAAAFAAELVADPSGDVRALALERLADAAPGDAVELALAGVEDPDPAVRMAAGRALGDADGRAVEHVLAALEDPRTVDAAIEAVRRLELDGEGDRVRDFVRSTATRAMRDRELAAAITSDGEEVALLRDALLDRGRRDARSALWAATMIAPRRAVMVEAIENLDSTFGQLANALETLETAGDPLVRPLLGLWEPAGPRMSGADEDWLARALADEDAFIGRCAELVRARREGGSMSGSTMTLSLIERVLFLRQVSLFADLPPVDLERVASVADELSYTDGELVAAEGELGQELHIVVDGTLRVTQDRDGSEHELARRTAGDVVGEMSIITQAPRIASLVADGDVRTVRIGHREFESMLRERPRVGLAVMRVLADRLAEGSRRPDPGEA